MGTILCHQCVRYEQTLEAYGHRLVLENVCLLRHAWFERVHEPQQCRDFEPGRTNNDTND